MTHGGLSGGTSRIRRAAVVLGLAFACAVAVSAAHADLVVVAGGEGRIVDATPQRVLIVTHDGGLRVEDVATAVLTDVPLPAGQHMEGAARLIEGGALFVTSSTDVTAAQLNEWRDGKLTSLGPINSTESIAVAGDYAIWNDGSSLYRLEVPSGTTTLVSTAAGNTDNDVAPNGDVVYWQVSDYTVHRWRNGIDSLISHASPLWATYPRTDGTTILYGEQTPCCTGQVAFSNGATETVLEDSYRSCLWSSTGSDYALNGGWIAYTRAPGNAYATEVWVRSPAGALARASPAESGQPPQHCLPFPLPPPRIFGVNPTGQTLYWGNFAPSSLSLGAPGVTVPFLLSLPAGYDIPGGGEGRVLWADGNWYLRLGDTNLLTWKLARVGTDTAIVTRPARLTTAMDATFVFASSAQAATYDCVLDGAAAAACSSAKSYTGLADGAHTLSVTSTDTSSGERDPTPALSTWVVDTTAPSSSRLTSPADGAAVATSLPTLLWEPASDAVSGVDGYDVRIDGSIVGSTSAADRRFTPVPGLAEGSHSWSVVARDVAGNTSESATAMFTVDTTAPAAFAATGPADGAVTRTARPTLSWTASSDAGSGLAGYTVSIDGAPVTTLPAGVTSFTLATELVDGTHVWQVTSRDAAGNASTTATRSLVVDTAAPFPVALAAPADGAVSRSATPTLNWAASSDAGTGLAGYTVSIDRAAVAALGPDASSFKPLSDLADGAHSWQVSARDNAGNSTASPVGTFTVDTRPPTPTLAIDSSPALTGDEVRFTAGTTEAPVYTIVDYAWDLDGDGTYETDTGASPTTAKTYKAPGAVSVGVRITNSKGRSNATTASLQVTAAPPPGNAGISINAAAVYATTTHVTLDVVWPRYATEIMISNDGGFARATTLPVSALVAWTLASSGAERLPKTVYARFLGPSIADATYQDDIILDQTPPNITTATVTAARRVGHRTTYLLRIRASDRTSGVRWLQLAGNRARPQTRIHYASVRQITTTAAPRWARAIDRAGNTSRWKQLVRH
jgi:hypothetical protein